MKIVTTRPERASSPRESTSTACPVKFTPGRAGGQKSGGVEDAANFRNGECRLKTSRKFSSPPARETSPLCSPRARSLNRNGREVTLVTVYRYFGLPAVELSPASGPNSTADVTGSGRWVQPPFPQRPAFVSRGHTPQNEQQATEQIRMSERGAGTGTETTAVITRACFVCAARRLHARAQSILEMAREGRPTGRSAESDPGSTRPASSKLELWRNSMANLTRRARDQRRARSCTWIASCRWR